MGIFSSAAPALWALGWPAIPLIRKDKRPAIAGWSAYCEVMPDEATRAAWLENYADGNIGMPMGPKSGFVAIDIDTDDKRVAAIVEKIAGPTPWVRVGKKGFVLLYKWNGEAISRVDVDTGEQDAHGRPKTTRLMEILGRGAQIVLPGSIHPDTGLPYVANEDLLTAGRRVQMLPTGFELQLRHELILNGYNIVERRAKERTKLSTMLTVGQRDTGLVQKAGALAGFVHRGEYTLQRAIDEMLVQVRDYVDNEDGEVDPTKHVENIIRFLIGDVRRSGKPVATGWDEQLNEVFAELVQPLRDYVAPSYNQFTEELKAAMASSPQGLKSDWLAMFAQKIVAAGLDDLEVARIARFIEQASGGDQKIKAGEFTRFFLRPAKAVAQSAEQIDNQLDAAMHFLARKEETGGLVSPQEGHILQWNGAFWIPTNESQLHQELQTYFGKTIKNYSDYGAIYKFLEKNTYLPSALPVSGVNFFNGFLDARGTLQPHLREHYQTYVLPFNYRPEAVKEAPCWFNFLKSAWGRDEDYEEKLSALQFALCMTFLGLGTRFQTCVLLFGKAESGKSTLLEVIRGMMPDEACSEVHPKLWDKRFNLMPMVGKTMNAVFELAENESIAGDVFKQIVEGTGVQIEEKNKPAFTFKSIATQWFCSNHVPRGRDSSRGFTRRWLTLVFNYSVKTKDKDLQLREKLLAEREGIFAWAMEARERVLSANTVPKPPSSDKIEATMRGLNNPVRRFLDSGMVEVVEKKTATLKSVIYERFSLFQLHEHDRQAVPMARFDEIMKDLSSEYGFEVAAHSFNGLTMRRPSLAA